jgi:hypothetical protein
VLSAKVEQQVRLWLDQFVVGLNLCPFARPLLGGETLRIVICEQTGRKALHEAFLTELYSTAQTEVATTLLVFPFALQKFSDYLSFLHVSEDTVNEAGLAGIVQLASFHPDYVFAGEDSASASHYSNRSPYPLIHLLREDMVSAAVADYPQPERIPARNIEALEKIGNRELARRWQALFSE